MLSLTLQDMLTKSDEELEALDPDCIGYCLYLVRDAETVLYIGKSNDPLQRLLQHFGKARTSSGAALGSFYQQHKDLAHSWTVDLYTLEDCEQLLSQDFKRGGSAHAERCLIQQFHPCLNEINNPQPSKLPERYQKLNLDHNAVDYLNF